MIDGNDQIAAVARQVSAPGEETRTVTLTQTYASDVDDVWDACTNAERIPRWFLPVSGDLCVGPGQLPGSIYPQARRRISTMSCTTSTWRPTHLRWTRSLVMSPGLPMS